MCIAAAATAVAALIILAPRVGGAQIDLFEQPALGSPRLRG
jgi:hypothetical protein